MRSGTQLKVICITKDTFLIKIIEKINIREKPEIGLIKIVRDFEHIEETVSCLNIDVALIAASFGEKDVNRIIKRILSSTPIPIILITRTDDIEMQTTFSALSNGALDFVRFPERVDVFSMKNFREMLYKKIIQVAKIKVVKQISLPFPADFSETPRKNHLVSSYNYESKNAPLKIVSIGISTGGPRVLAYIFQNIKENVPASFLVVQHIPIKFIEGFYEVLKKVSNLPVILPIGGEKIERGKVYLAPANYHMRVSKKHTIRLSKGEKVNGHRPSCDVLMESVAPIFKENNIGILLTGMGDDGVEGLLTIKKCGGLAIVQDESTSTVFGMPGTAVKRGIVDYILPLQEIPAVLVELLK